MLDIKLKEKQLFAIELFFIFAFSLFPLFFSLPYRDNLYLTWEGAYRLYIGQVPYKDFGMPLGFGFFLIPTAFFKIFGPFLASLLKAQAFLNILTLLSFRYLLKALSVKPVIILLSTIIFCFSYTFIFFWPWYNNTAFAFELFAVQFTVTYIFKQENKFRILFLLLASLFTFLSFFTKQDYGGLAFVFCSALIFFNCIYERKIAQLLIYLGSTAVIGFLCIKPFLKYGFSYWFNYGQPPHQSRLKSINFINEVLGSSNWEKLYILIIIIILIYKIQDIKSFIKDKRDVFFVIITLGFVAEALITKVTSRLPSDTTTYFHAFAFAYILSSIKIDFAFEKITVLPVIVFFIFIWWSAMFWKYAGRILKISEPAPVAGVKEAAQPDTGPWIPTGLRSFGKVTIPEKTVKGIHKILELNKGKNGSDLKVLNMSELTPLSYELNYTPLSGMPLWYHLNIGMFQKEVDYISNKIRNKEFDMVLFEEIPSLDNFYPEQLREVLSKNYKLIDTFPAPRKEGESFIEVYQKY